MVRDPSAIPQMLSKVSRATKDGRKYGIHRVDGPEHKSETSNGGEKGAGLVVLGHCLLTTVHRELVDDDKVGNASHGIISPLLTAFGTESSEESSQDHDEISNNGDEDVRTAQSSEECKIEEQERGGDAPIHVTSPVYRSVDVLGGVGSVLVGFLEDDVVVADAVTGSHGEVGDGSEGGDEGSQDVEQAFLLWSIISLQMLLMIWRIGILTTGTRKAIT